MKKLLLVSVSALALSAGAAFANDVDTQYGNIAVVAIPAGASQALAPTAYGNSSTVEQVGSGNTVGGLSGTAAQYGVNQQVGSWASANLSVIHQGGPDSPNGLKSRNSSATVTQQGSIGYGQASSLINQDSGAGNNTSSVGNSASVTQIVGLNQQVSYSTINQSGTNLIASVNQGTAGAVNNVSSFVSQSGTGATASVSQQVDGAQSIVLQSGTGNGTATGTTPNALPSTPNVYVSQTAGTDVSGVSQNSNNLGTVSVTQSGSYQNTSQVWQTAAANATVSQGGSTNNQSAIYQTGAGTANVNQTGTGSGTLNMSAINQSGTGTINVNQGYDLGGAGGTLETAAVSASSNYSGVTQRGDGTVDVYQSGISGLTNLSTVDQGNTSHATVYQTASIANNTSSISQSGGANNTANVRQH